MCLGKSRHAHHHRIAPAPDLVCPLTPDQNSGIGARAYPFSAIARILNNVDIYVDRHYTVTQMISHEVMGDLGLNA